MNETWEPPSRLGREDIVRASVDLERRPDLPIKETETVVRLDVAGFAWDVGSMTYEPTDRAHDVVGADGRRAGIFIIHGGSHDFRPFEPIARLLAGKYGYKVVSMTFPGQLYLNGPDRAWPGETIRGDGTARTPIWVAGQEVDPGDYELVEDASVPELRARHGTMYFVRAREGSEFYHRLAAAPLLYETALRRVIADGFPAPEFSVYLHGHSTGGPQVHSVIQRIDNVRGLVGLETSPFGEVFSSMMDYRWRFDFDHMTVRTWRDIARYRGREMSEAELRNLPQAMEEVFEEWEEAKSLPNIKFQDLVQFCADDALEHAARVTAARLELDQAGTDELVARYLSYPRPLAGEGARPVPPLLYGITSGSADHRPERYFDILVPYLARLDPPPKVRVVRYDAGVHYYLRPEADLPLGVGPAAAEVWHGAITGGYFVDA